MSNIVKIDDEVISMDKLINNLKLMGRFDGLVEEIVRAKLLVHAAKRKGIGVSPEDVQERSEQFRRVLGLHRAKDTMNYLDALGVTLDDLEEYLTDQLYQERMLSEITSEEAVDGYFKLHSPRFDSVEVSHIVLDTEAKAREIVSILEDDPEAFSELAMENSIAETSKNAGKIGKILRGSLSGEIESKLFNAEENAVVGPFASSNGSRYEVFHIDSVAPATLDDETRSEIKSILKESWMSERAKEHQIRAA
ncbi:peptidylprolyl isomerase [Thiothrix nivea]|uniref:peptidylprolyl isomerase n=1 Tax=Thiothrix nivea (strain ATCC 35100 / DSM 5205 / JP2) TaxID=870187 RepID=A0A656HJ29_THINJ|nr:peptidylprolyl isomerase [Thiothrix nivea]EIJ35239.1 PpiC-type peptidyl-prolyl cis-trans isomerase [Thiothrix nivea DSM 5205]